MSLPDRPDHPAYAEILSEIRAEKSVKRRHQMMAAVAERDFWFFMRYVHSLGRAKIKDRGHAHKGQLITEEKWYFDRCREVQDDAEHDRDGVLYTWPRGHYKTVTITSGLTLWEIAKDSSHRFAILTHKLDKVGMMITEGLGGEVEKNPRYHQLWPQTFAKDPNDYALFTKTEFTVFREAGPKEPTVSIHAIDSAPHGGHFSRLVFDDTVTSKAVRNANQMDKVEKLLAETTPLAEGGTISRHVGTIWDKDDPNMRALKKGVFSRHSTYAAMTHPNGLEWTAGMSMDGWVPVMRSREELEKWRLSEGEYGFASQYMTVITARAQQNFNPAWIREYANAPLEEAKGKEIHAFLDAAGERKNDEAGDYWCLRVTGFGSDGNKYQLDLWRERLTLPEAYDLIFAAARVWKFKRLWIEENGAAGIVASLRIEQEHRMYRSFRVDRMPDTGRRAKEARILLLQPMYQRGEIYYPQRGFGHGSGPRFRDILSMQAQRLARTRNEPLVMAASERVENHDDTYNQFREDEYGVWAPTKGAVRYDDCFDCEAWLAQPEVAAHLPKFEKSEDEIPPLVKDAEGKAMIDLSAVFARQREQNSYGMRSAPSPYVF